MNTCTNSYTGAHRGSRTEAYRPSLNEEWGPEAAEEGVDVVKYEVRDDEHECPLQENHTMYVLIQS